MTAGGSTVRSPEGVTPPLIGSVRVLRTGRGADPVRACFTVCEGMPWTSHLDIPSIDVIINCTGILPGRAGRRVVAWSTGPA